MIQEGGSFYYFGLEESFNILITSLSYYNHVNNYQKVELNFIN